MRGFWRRVFQFKKEAELPGYSECFDLYNAVSSRPISEVRFVSLDTETTGLNPAKDQILSIAAVSILDGKARVEDSFYRLITHEQVSASIGIHHITPADSKSNGVCISNAIKDFAVWVKDSVLVGHHVAFDKSILSHALYTSYGLHLKNQTVDTALLAIRLFEAREARDQIKISDYTLEKLAAAVFLALLRSAEKRGIRKSFDLISR
jgi:DNA polymerase-3 subunit epsilon